MVTFTEQQRDELVDHILQSRKYRGLNIPASTVADLLTQETGNQTSTRTLVKVVRQKMHNIVAPYLGDPDYDRAASLPGESFCQRHGGRCAPGLFPFAGDACLHQRAPARAERIL